MMLIATSVAPVRRAEGQAEALRSAVSVAQGDPTSCLKRECLSWKKEVQTPNGKFLVTRCATAPRQQVELALAARMMSRETSNVAWNELAIIALASAFIHQTQSYLLVQASQAAAIAELDRRLDNGEYGTTLRPGGAKAYLALAAKWFDAPQCVH